MCRDKSLTPCPERKGGCGSAENTSAWWRTRASFRSCNGTDNRLGWYTHEGRHRDWSSYYAHYRLHLNHADVLLKIDDDIIFVHGLRDLVVYVQRERPSGWVFPSIINNDVMGLWQMKDQHMQTLRYDVANVLPIRLMWERHRRNDFKTDGSDAPFSSAMVCSVVNVSRGRPPKYSLEKRCPLTSWSSDWNAAMRSVSQLLTRPAHFLCPAKATRVWPHLKRVSINFFAGTGAHVKARFGEMLQCSVFEPPRLAPWG